MPKLNHCNDLETLRQKLQEGRKGIRSTIIICGGTGCQATKCLSVVDAVKKEIVKQGLDKQVLLRTTGCHGFCEQGPLMVVEPGNFFYCHLTAADAQEIVSSTLKNGKVVDRLLYTDPLTGKKIKTEADIPFYSAQDRQLLKYSKLLNPCSIDDYIAIGGYTALVKTLTGIAPKTVIEEIKSSGLRGRGGGGFPTGRKWAEARSMTADEKYVVCNADEGDPGAYMDRCVLEANPHLIIEGMMIGAWAIGARQGYIYVRKEYPLAVDHIKTKQQMAMNPKQYSTQTNS